jgi:hypothetical protein
MARAVRQKECMDIALSVMRTTKRSALMMNLASSAMLRSYRECAACGRRSSAALEDHLDLLQDSHDATAACVSALRHRLQRYKSMCEGDVPDEKRAPAEGIPSAESSAAAGAAEGTASVESSATAGAAAGTMVPSVSAAGAGVSAAGTEGAMVSAAGAVVPSAGAAFVEDSDPERDRDITMLLAQADQLEGALVQVNAMVSAIRRAIAR